MRMVLVLVNDEQGPIAIGPLDRIRGYEHMAGTILDVAGGRVHAMHLAAGLQPLKIDQLAGEELSERLVDLVIGAHCEHPEGAAGIVASRMHSHGNVMEVVETIAARSQERADIISQPERSHDVDGALRTLPGNI